MDGLDSQCHIRCAEHDVPTGFRVEGVDFVSDLPVVGRVAVNDNHAGSPTGLVNDARNFSVQQRGSHVTIAGGILCAHVRIGDLRDEDVGRGRHKVS